MSRILALAVTLPLVALAVAVTARGRSRGDDGPRTPVLVELFTSEGCSSCPPADTLLRHLHEAQPVDGADVIVLSEHVDYWNRTGWTDPFSSPAFTDRQTEYVRRLGAESLYTPQAVVDGGAEVIGNDQPAVAAAVRKAAARPHAPLAVEVGDAGAPRLRVAVSGAGVPAGSQILVAIAEDDLTVDVRGGENARRRLRHVGVVRHLARVGSVSADGRADARTTLTLDPAWRREALRVVAIAQAPGQGLVTGLGVARLARP